MNKKFYTLAQWTWGLPQTLAGAALYLACRKKPSFDYKGAKVTVWNKDSGISLGKFIFVPGTHDQFLLDHEFGHSVQSLILGPAYFILVGAPSFLWNRLPYFRRLRKKTGRSYYSVPFEKSANKLGRRNTLR
ncbi:MAG: hypothetical protein IJH43_05800 [Mogibacterium sp.]|nr:hypothetical protein [Mogibacterium sp.]